MNLTKIINALLIILLSVASFITYEVVKKLYEDAQTRIDFTEDNRFGVMKFNISIYYIYDRRVDKCYAVSVDNKYRSITNVPCDNKVLEAIEADNRL